MLFLVDFRSLLQREMEAVEAERDRGSVEGESADRLDAPPVVRAGADDLDSPAESEPAPGASPSVPEREPDTPGVAVGWSSVINPETGAVIERDGLIPRGPRPSGDNPGPLDSSVEALSAGGELPGTEAKPTDEAEEANGEATP
jgi:hypothetical protein